MENLGEGGNLTCEYSEQIMIVSEHDFVSFFLPRTTVKVWDVSYDYSFHFAHSLTTLASITSSVSTDCS